jgi:regulator of sirC expression with transglutaminase-like and TPR domain
MVRLGKITAFVGIVLGAIALRADDTNESKPPNEATPNGRTGTESDQQIARLIQQLDADSFEVREGAARQLREIGRPALAALQRAATHPSLEVRWRAKAIAEGMTAGVRLREFTAFASLPDERLDREEGMWLIARILNPEVKKQDLRRQLDALADRVRKQLGKGVDPTSADPQIVVAALRQVLNVDQGFTGNVEEYNHPDNSSLERVLATKKGLPILLSHVAIAVSRRLSVPIIGVPASGRYIIKYDGSQAPPGFAKEDIYLNPFEDFKILTRDDRARAFPIHDPDTMVPPDTSREALTRMLRNLIPDLENRGEMDKLRHAQQLLDLLEAYTQPGKL